MLKYVRCNKLRHIEVRFHIFYFFWGEEYRALYRGLRYAEVL